MGFFSSLFGGGKTEVHTTTQQNVQVQNTVNVAPEIGVQNDFKADVTVDTTPIANALASNSEILKSISDANLSLSSSNSILADNSTADLYLRAQALGLEAEKLNYEKSKDQQEAKKNTEAIGFISDVSKNLVLGAVLLFAGVSIKGA